MDVTRFMVRTRRATESEEVYNIQINYNVFRIKVMEEAQGSIGLLSRRNTYLNLDTEA